MSGFFRPATMLAATLSTGLIAGLIFCFSVAVMPGLGKSDDRSFVTTMQSIVRAILNGWFMVAFLGTLGFIALAAFLNKGHRTLLIWIAAAFVLSLLTWIITMAFNVPLNRKLEAAGNPDHISNFAAVREHFEGPWIRWNLVRTFTSTAALGCMAWAMVLYGRVTGKGGA